MTELNIVLASIGGLVLFLGLVSRLLRRWGLPDPLIALAVGVLLGPSVGGLLDPAHWGSQEKILEEVARIALGVGLMGVALRLPKEYPLRNWRALVVLLGAAMLWMWLSSSFLIYALVGVSPWIALLIGAVVTPTDPVAASSIVTGEVAEQNLPERLRHLLSAESGSNDGLAYLFVLLPILWLTRPPGEAIVHWLTRTLLWEVTLAVLVGAGIGYGAGRLLEWAEANDIIEEPSILAYTLALALFTLGIVKLIGSDGLLAVFVAGVAFDLVISAGERVEEERVVEGVDRFLILPIFALLGLVIPWQKWVDLGWHGVVLVVGVLLLRRLPVLLVLKAGLRPLRGTPDALFLGWFGPIGVAAIFYANLSLRRTGTEEVVWVVASLLICASILVHGLTATPLTRLYGTHTGQRTGAAHEPADE